MSRERPILFSAPMVRAILEGRKTQTRRVVKPQPVPIPAGSWNGCEGKHWWKCNAVRAMVGIEDDLQGFDKSMAWCLNPYGKPGDRLWVKETFFAWGYWETRYSGAKGRDEWHFVDDTDVRLGGHRYAASMSDNGSPARSAGVVRWWKRPALFMPQAASRITLEVTDVRVQRLKSISAPDAWDEGVPGSPDVNPLHEFEELWETINGAGAWDANPWVWVVTFTKQQPADLGARGEE